MPRINPDKWRASLTVKQLAKRFGVVEVSIYSYARRNGLNYKPQTLGRPKQEIKLPTMPKHKRIIKLYENGETNIRVIANEVRMSYHATYRVITRYKLYRKNKNDTTDVS